MSLFRLFLSFEIVCLYKLQSTKLVPIPGVDATSSTCSKQVYFRCLFWVYFEIFCLYKLQSKTLISISGVDAANQVRVSRSLSEDSFTGLFCRSLL